MSVNLGRQQSVLQKRNRSPSRQGWRGCPAQPWASGSSHVSSVSSTAVSLRCPHGDSVLSGTLPNPKRSLILAAHEGSMSSPVQVLLVWDQRLQSRVRVSVRACACVCVRVWRPLHSYSLVRSDVLQEESQIPADGVQHWLQFGTVAEQASCHPSALAFGLRPRQHLPQRRP